MGTKKKTNITDIQLNISKKEQFRINGDDSKIIELDISDLGVLNRLRESYPRLQDLGMKGFESESDEDSDTKTLGEYMDALDNINAEMCDILNYIFDSDIAKTCSFGKPLYNMVAGKFIFEIIMDTLFGLYSDSIKAEFGEMSTRMKSHTSKYTGN